MTRAQVVTLTQIAMASSVEAAFDIYDKNNYGMVFLRVVGEYGEERYKLFPAGGSETISKPVQEPLESGTPIVEEDEDELFPPPL